jgi:hypothetical protein
VPFRKKARRDAAWCCNGLWCWLWCIWAAFLYPTSLCITVHGRNGNMRVYGRKSCRSRSFLAGIARRSTMFPACQQEANESCGGFYYTDCVHVLFLAYSRVDWLVGRASDAKRTWTQFGEEVFVNPIHTGAVYGAARMEERQGFHCFRFAKTQFTVRRDLYIERKTGKRTNRFAGTTTREPTDYRRLFFARRRTSADYRHHDANRAALFSCPARLSGAGRQEPNLHGKRYASKCLFFACILFRKRFAATCRLSAKRAEASSMKRMSIQRKGVSRP